MGVTEGGWRAGLQACTSMLKIEAHWLTTSPPDLSHTKLNPPVSCAPNTRSPARWGTHAAVPLRGTRHACAGGTIGHLCPWTQPPWQCKPAHLIAIKAIALLAGCTQWIPTRDAHTRDRVSPQPKGRGGGVHRAPWGVRRATGVASNSGTSLPPHSDSRHAKRPVRSAASLAHRPHAEESCPPVAGGPPGGSCARSRLTVHPPVYLPA